MSTEMELEIVAYLNEPLVEALSSGHQRLKEGCNVRTGSSTLSKQEVRRGRGERGREVRTIAVASCKLLVQFAGTWKRLVRPTER